MFLDHTKTPATPAAPVMALIDGARSPENFRFQVQRAPSLCKTHESGIQTLEIKASMNGPQLYYAMRHGGFPATNSDKYILGDAL